MEERPFTSSLLEEAVTELSRLPGVGRKTALRLALHLLRRDERETDNLSNALSRLRHEVRYCRQCHNISETELCPVCSSPLRDSRTVCVVENVKDVMSIENTSKFQRRLSCARRPHLARRRHRPRQP